jgi:universal stress protein E
MEEMLMSRPLKTIVICTSLTNASDDVVRAGVTLAQATGASPWLIHAYIPYLPLAMPPGGGIDSQMIEEQAKDLQERIAEQARRTGLSALAGFSSEHLRLAVGAPHREIVELARNVQADLVVMGAAETRGILGSTADRVIRKVHCPVLAVRPEAAFPPVQVEIPVDLSPISANALRQGLDILAQIGAPLSKAEVLFVLNPLELAGSIHFTSEQIQRFANEELHRFLAVNLPDGARPRLTRVRTGYPREEILAGLTERHADIAVLGTHGRGGFERLVIGSVAAWLLRNANCNLLVIPPVAEQQHDAITERREELADADWSYVSDETAGCRHEGLVVG